MKPARLAVLAVALAAGAGAAYLMMGSKPPEPVRVVAPPPPPVATDGVLVAAREINFGSVISDADMRWQKWPRADVPPGTIVQSREPAAIADYKGAIVRGTFNAGEPLRADRLIRGNGSGFMAAVLPSGLRAIAIDLSDQGKSAAGGFILPNDHVDVIRTFHPDDAPNGGMTSETILTNIRVLAIGQNVQEKAGERTVIGSTATLEMTAQQAEKAVLAQRTGQLTLSLRSMADAAKDDTKPADQPMTMTIIRSGNASQTRVK